MAKSTDFLPARCRSICLSGPARTLVRPPARSLAMATILFSPPCKIPPAGPVRPSGGVYLKNCIQGGEVSKPPAALARSHLCAGDGYGMGDGRMEQESRRERRGGRVHSPGEEEKTSSGRAKAGKKIHVRS